MEPDFTVKRHDYGFSISGVFRDANGDAVDLTGYTSAKIFMTQQGASTPTINGRNFTIVNEAAGTWSYTWRDGDTDLDGRFNMELEATLPDKVITYPTDPNNPYLVVLIEPDLGDASGIISTGWSLEFSLAQNSGYLASV